MRTLRLGRGMGATEAKVCDFATIGGGHVMHILDGEAALCGRGYAPLASVERDVDARAVRVRNLPVCAACRARLGVVSAPQLIGAQVA